jgi:hypothetical protein
MLLDKGADVNAQGGFYGNALQAASGGGHEKIVQMLAENRASRGESAPPKRKRSPFAASTISSVIYSAK